jgi:polyhydroxyalkanoate synthesis regulator phasin
MNEQLQEILYTALGVLLTGAISYLFMLLRTFTLSKIKNEELKQIVGAGLTVVETVVADVSENFVKELKKQGKFNKEAAEEALRLTVAKARVQITAETQALITKHFGDFEQWLSTQIEAVIAYNK